MANNIKGITVEIGGNTGPLDKALKDVNKTSRDLQGELREVNRQLKLDPTNTTLLAQKQKLLAESVTTTKSKLDSLKEAEKQAQQQFKEGKISEEQYRALQREVIKTENKLKNLESQASKSNATLNKISETTEKVGSAAGKIGDKMMPATAAIAGAGAAASKFSIDFEDGVAKASTIADESEVSIGDLRKGILKLSDDTGIAATEISNNVYDAISAGQKTGDAVNFVQNSTKLAKAGFAEAGQSLDILTTIMNSYGMKAEEVTKVSDILINTQNLGKVTVGELSASMGKVIPTANAFGVNLEQVASGYAIMTAKGVKAAETTTYMNSMFNEMGKSGTKASDVIKQASGKTFPELIKSGKSVGDILNIMNEHAKKNKLSLSDMFGSAEAGKAALILSNNAGKDFNEMLKSMNNTAGATDKAFEKVSNTTGAKLKKSFNQLKNDAIKLGDSIAPIIQKISNLAGALAQKLSGLSKNQLDMVVKVGLVVAAIGPVAKLIQGITIVVGGLTTVISTITGAIGLLTGSLIVATPAATALAGAITFITGPIGIAIAAMIGIGAAAIAIHKHFSKEAVPSIDLFANKTEQTAQRVKAANGQITTKISEQTKKAIGSYMELDKGATKSLTNLYTNGTKITQKNGKELQNMYTKMNAEIKKGIDKQHQDRIKGIQKFFANSKSMTAKEKAQIIAKEQQHNSKMQSNQQALANKINSIIQNAASKNRQLKAEEVKEIEVCQEQMQGNAVKHLSKTEAESKVIMERIKSYNGRMSAEQASDVIKNAENQRVKSVDEANKQFIETKSNIENMRDVTHSITKEQADKMIKEAEKQRDGSVKKAGELKQGVVNKVKEMNSDVAKNVDTSDGHIKTTWEKTKESVSGKAQEMKNAVVKAFEEKKKQVSDKCSEIKVSVSNKWNEIVEWFNTLPSRLREKAHNMFEAMKQGINEKMASVKQSATDIGENIKNAFNNIPQAMLTIGHDIMEGLKNGIRNKIESVKEAANEAANAVEQKVKSALGINSPSRVMMEFGRYTSQGLALGILEDLDKVEEAATLAAQTIKNITEGKLSDVKIKTNTNDREIKDRVARQLNWGVYNKNEYQKYLEFIDKLNKEEVEQSKEYLKEDYENRVKSLDDRLRILKNENNLELQTEKSRIEAQIAHYQSLQRNAKDKNTKANYANQIAALKQYQKQVLNTTKANQKAQVETLERSKKALEEYYKDGLNLLDKREKEVKKSLKVQENVFNNTINEYNEAIKRLQIDTKDLNKNLLNNQAIVILQGQRIEVLKNRYEELAKTFGHTAEETVKAKKALEEAKIELINMGNTVDDVKQKIIDAQKEADKKIADSINNIVDRVKNALKQKYEDELKAQEDHINNEIKNLDRWKDESIKRITEVYDTKIKAIEAQLEEEDKADKDAEELKKISQLETSLEYEHNEFNKAEIQKELNNLLKEREKRLHKEQLEEQKKQLQKEKEGELEKINSIYESNKKNLEKQLEDYRSFCAKKIQDAVLQAEAEKLIMDNNQKEIVELLHSYEEAYKQAGQSLGEKLVEGFKPKIEELKDMIASIQESFEVARNSALNSMASKSVILNSIPSSSNVSSSTTDNRKSIVNHNSFAFNSPKALNPSEIRRNTETTLRNLAF
ncbi:phage tail tape measure protein [Clostridium botulinum]|uniref:phage tail tape measure protein n=1 Tax=Clostridium botulinum TaxID=1491 RepID=UPI003EF429BC